MTQVQSVTFNKSIWTVVAARRWLRQHDFLPIKRVDKTPTLLRYRIKPPKQFKRFRNKSIATGINLVVGFK